jgi:MFS family permease
VNATSSNTPSRLRSKAADDRRVILASSAGTIFEWYDFYLYGSMTAIIGQQFFSAYPESTRAIFALLAFAAGFVVRPFGALLFGRVGDIVGRKYTFLVTILIMGLSTFLVGLLPNYATIGNAAPIILIVLRLTQGLALGGEYGGAAIFVAEHAPQGRRGYYTSFIQATATLGLLLSLIVITFTQIYVNAHWSPGITDAGADAFSNWGWRIPFLFSFVLLAISLYIRLQMNESPVFMRIKQEGSLSKAPLSEAFAKWRNAKIALIALLGLVAGQAVIWYTGQFYALFFLQNVLKVDNFTANVLVAWSLCFGAPFFIFFGWLSDIVGRKPIILGGCIIAALAIMPLFKLLVATTNPALAAAQSRTVVEVIADPADCSFQFNPAGTAKFSTSCDIAKALLAKDSVMTRNIAAAPGTKASVRIDGHIFETTSPTFVGDVTRALRAAGYPDANHPHVAKIDVDLAAGLGSVLAMLDIFSQQKLTIIALLTLLVVLVAMVYGPLAAALVELFPTRIRYSGLSLPYHIGNGWFGGLLPATAFAMAAQTGNIFYGLWYPIAIAAMTVVVGLVFVPETRRRNILEG